MADAVVDPDEAGPGCADCAWAWPATGAGRERVGISAEHVTEIHRCRVCGTYWEYPMGSYPHRISARRAASMLE